MRDAIEGVRHVLPGDEMPLTDPEEIRDRIFYPLVSGREGGSGLGLSLAQSFIEQHQGMIEVDSRPGRTCFTILLPITERA